MMCFGPIKNSALPPQKIGSVVCYICMYEIRQSLFLAEAQEGNFSLFLTSPLSTHLSIISHFCQLSLENKSAGSQVTMCKD